MKAIHTQNVVMRLFVSALLLQLCAAAGLCAALPNVVVILTDDQGWGDLSLHGNKNLSTPRLDALAKSGAQFARFYVCPVCSPTRAEFLTGRYHARGGVYSTSAGGERLDLDEATIGDVFKAAGYTTGCFGKWHNGMQYPYHPNGRGFDEYYGFCSGHWGNYFDAMLEHNGELVRGKGFMVDDLTDHAMAFIEEQAKAGKPSFTYLPLNTPHSPMQVPDQDWDKFKDKELAQKGSPADKENIGHTRAALAMCENVDRNVGRVLDHLDKLDIAKDTIVVFFCDNGPNGIRWNGEMKGRKGSTDEGGVRSPLFIRWPGKIKGRTIVNQISAAIDLLPSLSALAGVQTKTNKPLDGIDWSSSLLNPEPVSFAPVRMVYSHWGKRVSVRTQRFRLDHNGQLYDMVKDPGQTKDISGTLPQKAKELGQAVDDWKKSVLSELEGEDLRQFPVGHPDFAVTQLPARDAKAFGELKRSNRFPNCSYYGNWKSTSDKLTWDIDVLETGDFDVDLYYTCAEANLGAVMELVYGEETTAAEVTVANDPPETGAEHDRVPRQESYVKDFKPIKLGKIHLEKGNGTLTLQAKQIPGEQAIDFRLMMLLRIP
jgi:arylsulfatase A-like enzyme